MKKKPNHFLKKLSDQLYLKIFLMIFAFFYSFDINAETWTCTYDHANEQKIFVRERTNGGFINPTNEYSYVEEILREDDELIHLYSPQDFYTMYYAIVLDKKDKKFSMVGLDPGNNTSIIEGDCLVY